MEPRKGRYSGCRRRPIRGRPHEGARYRELPDDPAWSETLACTDTLCSGTGRSRGRPRRHTAVGPHREGEEPEPMMHGHEKSDPAILAKKPANNAGQPAAERVERRAGTEGNAGQQSTRRAQNRESVSQALERVRQVCRQTPE